MIVLGYLISREKGMGKRNRGRLLWRNACLSFRKHGGQCPPYEGLPGAILLARFDRADGSRCYGIGLYCRGIEAPAEAWPDVERRTALWHGRSDLLRSSGPARARHFAAR